MGPGVGKDGDRGEFVVGGECEEELGRSDGEGLVEVVTCVYFFFLIPSSPLHC